MPLQILIVSPKFLPAYAGWIQQTLTMIQACDPDKVSFTWISPQVGSVPAVEEWSFLSIRRIGPSMNQNGGRLHRLIFGINAAKYLIQHRHTFDLVYCPQSYTPTDVVSLVGRLIGKPVVTRIAAGEMIGNHYGARLRRWLLPKFASGLVVLNRKLFTLLAEGKWRNKIHRISNGVNTAHFHPPTPDQRRAARKRWQLSDGEKMILFIGSIVPGKGVDTLVSAFMDVQRLHPNSSLYLVGPMSATEKTTGRNHYVQNLRALIKEKHLEKKVWFLGQISNVVEIMHAADLFVLPSLSEGMPNALLEAMACGLPCIGSDIPGIRDVITDGRDGLLFEASNHKALATRLEECLNEPERLKNLGIAARSTVEQRFSIQHTARSYQDLFRSIVENESNAA